MTSFDLTAIGDHLWQSTLFAVAAGGLTLLLRRHSARTRYVWWLLASAKFLVPFSILTAAGALIPWSTASVDDAPRAFLENARHLAAPIAQWTSAQGASNPSTNQVQVVEVSSSGSIVLPALAVLWALGTLTVALRWLARWRLVRRALHDSTPVNVSFDVPVRASSHQFEPGVIGILRPQLLLPRGLDECLTVEQLRAVLAHERCHVAWRDNLGALQHMIVETLFWFHPLVWWIGTRLIDERERACDEQVLAEGHAPEEYADGVLKVCEHFLGSRLPCVSGVSGADLKQRIRSIMHGRSIRTLSSLQRAALAAAAFLVIVAPVALGTLGSPPAKAEVVTPSPTVPALAAGARATSPGSRALASSTVLAQAAKPSPALLPQAIPTEASNSQGRLVFWNSPPGTNHPQNGSISVRPGGIFFQNIPLHYLIAEAYGVALSQLEGIRWYEDGSAVPPCCIRPYSIRTDGATLADAPRERISFEPAVPDQHRPALRDFLAREFGLVVRRSERQVDGYVITTGSAGTRLRPTEDSPPEILRFSPLGHVTPFGDAGLGVEVSGFSAGEFAVLLSKALNTSFVDETRLQGKYYFDAWLPRDGSPPRNVAVSEIVTKMEEQYGLHVGGIL